MTTPTTAAGVEGVKALEGRHLGYTPYLEITQEMVDRFAEATGDHQWIHVDPERARDGPFGGTIAHGYLTLSLTPMFLPQLIGFEGFSMGVNYGCDKLRFPKPVAVGAKLRAGAQLDTATEISGGVQAAITLTFETEGQEKPNCVARILLRQYV